MSFISNSTSLKKINICNYEKCVPVELEFLRKCILAAKFNHQVSSIDVESKLSNSALAKLSEFLWTGAEKITILRLYETEPDADINELKLFATAVASLRNLKELHLTRVSDDVLSNMMAELALLGSSKLQELRFDCCSRMLDRSFETQLPGVDLFLASAGACSVKELHVRLENCTTLAAERLSRTSPRHDPDIPQRNRSLGNLFETRPVPAEGTGT